MPDALHLHGLARQHERLRRLARALVKSEHEAEDLVQDAWVRAIERGPKDPEALGGWLARVTRNLASNSRRGRQRRDAREAAAARDEALPSSADIAARVDLEARLLEALEGLAEPHRTLLRDRYLGELSPAQLAARDGLSNDAVKSRLRRARAALRERLERDGFGGEVHWTLALMPLVVGPQLGPPSVPAPDPSSPIQTAEPLARLAPGGSAAATSLLGLALAMKQVLALALVVTLGLVALKVTGGSPETPLTHGALDPGDDSGGDPQELIVGDEEALETGDPSAAGASTRSAASENAGPAEVAGDTWTVRGRFRGRGVSGVPNARFDLRTYRGFEIEGEPLEVHECATDAEGRFQLELPRPPHTVCFDVVPEPVEGRRFVVYEPYLAPLGDPEPEEIEVLVFDIDASVAGIVVDSDGAPIADALVKGAYGETTTAGDGSFEMSVASSAWGRIRASAKGFGTTQTIVEGLEPGGTARVEIRLLPGVQIMGTVTDDLGRPVQAATVSIWGVDVDDVQTDAAGRYAIDRLNLDVTDRDTTVAVRGPGVNSASKSLEMRFDESEYVVDFVLERGVTVFGRVEGPDGQPVVGAEVWVGWSEFAWDRAVARSGDDGRFRMESVRPGTTKCGASKQGFVVEIREVELLGGEELVISLAHPLTIRGVVRTKDGSAVPNVSVSARQDDRYVGGRARTNESGAFELGGLPLSGDLRLEAYGGGWVRGYADVADGTVDGIVVTLERNGVLAGTVVDAETGAPVESFTVRLDWPKVPVEGETLAGIGSNWHGPGKSFNDPSGYWSTGEHDELGPGRWTMVEVSAPGYASTRIEAVQVSPGDEIEPMVHALVRPVDVEVSLRAAPGDLPVEGATVLASREQVPSDVERTWQAKTGAAGVALIKDVAPGPLFVRVQREDRCDVYAGPFEIRPGAALVEVDVPIGRTVEVELRGAQGAAVPEATLVLAARGTPSLTYGRVAATTNSEGIALFAEVPPGKWHVGQSFGGIDSGVMDLGRDVEIPADGDVPRIVLEPSGRAIIRARFEGEVVVPDGTIVRLESNGEKVRATSATDGGFVVTGVEPGSYVATGRFWDNGRGQLASFEAAVTVDLETESVPVTVPVQIRR